MIRQKIAEQTSDKDQKTDNIKITYNDAGDLIRFPGRFPTLKETEESLIEEALKRAEGNQTIAADLLGISRRALNNRLKRADENNNK